MNIEKNRCIEYFINQRLLLDEKLFRVRKKKEYANNNLEKINKIRINMDKYNNHIILGVIIYMVLTFSLVR